MTKVLEALDAFTSLVLSYRPKGKGEAATKVRKQIAKADKKAKKDGARE